ncbi:MAG: hypothetical protein WC870_03070 [Candidatus Paceibacterota bacterium]
MKKENIEKLALTVATLIADISQKVVSSWKNELKVLKNIEIHPSAYGTLLLESAIFGHYYVGEKFKQHMEKNEQKIFSNELNDKMVLVVSLLLDHKDKEKDFAKHKEMIKEMYENFAPSTHKFLEGYKGNSILDVFRIKLRQTFNDNRSFGIRFFENTLKNKIMIKWADYISGSKEKNEELNGIFLDETVINILANSLFSEFSTLDYNQLCKEINETI